jgi:serine O-acetyltransferase
MSTETLPGVAVRRGEAPSADTAADRQPQAAGDRSTFRTRVRSDVARYGGTLDALSMPGFWALLIHRVAHALHSHRLDLPARGLQLLSQVALRCDISRKAVLGPGIQIFHASGIFIGPHTRIGRDATVGPEVFVGCNTRWNDWRDYPVIGDRVILGPGAKVIGGLTIGADTRVGPNAVVMSSVPPWSVVAAAPCRVMSRQAWSRATSDRPESQTSAGGDSPLQGQGR